MEGKMKNSFSKCRCIFFDYGLQVFSHTEYDILQYILRNTIGWNRLECEISIKKMALMKRYSEKNIIKAVNNLIEKTSVFSKVVYYEKGSCIKKTKYIITENSVKLLNKYIIKNIPTDFETKIENLKNRSMEAIERLEKGKQELLEKQSLLLESVNTENAENTIETMIENADTKNETENKKYLLESWKEILNDYSSENYRIADYGDTELDYSVFNDWKQVVYDSCLGYIPKETDTEKIDIRLSDLIPFTDNQKVIDLLKTLVKNKKMIGGQKDYFYNTLKINFGIENEKNFDRINIIYE